MKQTKTLILGAGLVAAALTLSSCGKSDSSSTASTTSGRSAPRLPVTWKKSSRPIRSPPSKARRCLPAMCPTSKPRG